MISFLFDRRSLGLWMFAAAAAAVLLFLSGIFVGLRINLPPQTVGGVEGAGRADLSGRLDGRSRRPVEPVSPVVPAPSPAPVPAPPPPPGQPAQPSSTSSTGSGYSVQLGAFREEGNARRLQEELEREGVVAHVVVDSAPSGAVLYAVREGRYRNEEEARSAASRLVAASGRDAWVAPPP